MSCIDEIIANVDFELIERQFKKYSINDYPPLFCIMHGMHSPSPTMRAKLQIVLDQLDDMPHGFQIFYRSLRETQDTCLNHKMVANMLIIKGTDGFATLNCMGMLCNPKKDNVLFIILCRLRLAFGILFKVLTFLNQHKS